MFNALLIFVILFSQVFSPLAFSDKPKSQDELIDELENNTSQSVEQSKINAQKKARALAYISIYNLFAKSFFELFDDMNSTASPLFQTMTEVKNIYDLYENPGLTPSRSKVAIQSRLKMLIAYKTILEKQTTNFFLNLDTQNTFKIFYSKIKENLLHLKEKDSYKYASCLTDLPVEKLPFIDSLKGENIPLTIGISFGTNGASIDSKTSNNAYKDALKAIGFTLIGGAFKGCWVCAIVGAVLLVAMFIIDIFTFNNAGRRIEKAISNFFKNLATENNVIENYTNFMNQLSPSIQTTISLLDDLDHSLNPAEEGLNRKYGIKDCSKMGEEIKAVEFNEKVLEDENKLSAHFKEILFPTLNQLFYCTLSQKNAIDLYITKTIPQHFKVNEWIDQEIEKLTQNLIRFDIAPEIYANLDKAIQMDLQWEKYKMQFDNLDYQINLYFFRGDTFSVETTYQEILTLNSFIQKELLAHGYPIEKTSEYQQKTQLMKILYGVQP